MKKIDRSQTGGILVDVGVIAGNFWATSFSRTTNR